MKRLILIGLDGIDSVLIKKYLDVLPTFQRLISKSLPVISKSTFPPDSDTAWASIYTGLNPANHGVVEFVDPLVRTKIVKNNIYKYTEYIKGKTFWDIAGKYNKKSCVIFPHLAFPVWRINGLMINSDPETGVLNYYPPDFKFNFKYDENIVLKRLPRTIYEYKKFIKNKMRTVENEFSFAINLLKSSKWDIFFFYSSTLDSVMHLFWNFCDPNDPTYPGPNQFENVIKDMHVLYDKFLGEMLSYADGDTSVLVFSDHGHSMRPVNLFNINEVLRINNLLIAKGGALAPLLNSKEKVKRGIVDVAQRYGIRPLAQSVLRYFPKIKNMYTKPSTIDFYKTIAHCTDLSGMKAYTYGGIKINRKALHNSNEYEKTREKIIEILLKYKIPNSEESVVNWIVKREDLYKGKNITNYPDLVFELKENYGVGWNINIPVFTRANSHKFFPGSHRGSTPIFYFMNTGKREAKKINIELMDIAPTILSFLDIDISEYNFDGTNIFK